MKLIENITRIEHKVFGEGIYIETPSPNMITVCFPNGGNKTLDCSIFETGLLQVKNEPFVTTTTPDSIIEQGSTIQYDTSNTQIGDHNIIESPSTSNSLVFNESYTLIGSILCAKNIYACYNLIVIGDIDADTIHTNGSLTVMGNATVKTLTCQGEFHCTGKLFADAIDVSKDIIANSIQCANLHCGGSVISQTTIDLKDSATEKVMFAGEGIIGEGAFSAHHAVGTEYFEYNGNILGKAIELDTNTSYTDTTSPADPQDISTFTFDALTALTKKKLSSDLLLTDDIQEDDLIDFVTKVSDVDINKASDWSYVFKRVIDISYLDEIDNFTDFLILFYANTILPNEIKNYETVEHIFGEPLQTATEDACNLSAKFNNIEDFALCVKIVIVYHELLGLSKEDSLDKIFQAVGIKFNTVKAFFK